MLKMKTLLIAGIVAGLFVGSMGTYFVMRSGNYTYEVEHSSLPEAGGGLDDPLAIGSDSSDQTTLDEPDWSALLSKLSGSWTSADGEQSANLDFRTLRFGRTGSWADLENHTYLLGQEMQFLSDSGYYTVCQMESPDALRIIKRDLVTEDVYGFTIYRADSRRARAREPLGIVVPPPSMQKLLDEIPNITPIDRKDTVLQRMGIKEDRMEILDGSSSFGETDLLLNLGVDGHWMLKLGYKRPGPEAGPSEAKLKRFQIVRGYIDDAREGDLDVEQFIYPYFVHDKVVAGPSKAEQAGTEQAATRPESKSENSGKPKAEGHSR